MGNRHLRRNTPSRPPETTARAPRKAARGDVAATPVEVTSEECAKLAGDLAYFNACTFREPSPGKLRKDDIECAEKEILIITGQTS